MARLASILKALCVLAIFLPAGAYAQEILEIEIPPDVSEEELERAVKAREGYINSLLAGDASREIEESGNEEAVEILQRARIEKTLIDEQISQGRFRDALKSLHRLHLSLMDALKIVGVRERKEKRLKADLETARVTNDAYFTLAEKKNVEAAGEKAVMLLNKAKEMRIKAEGLMQAEKYSEALGFLEASTDQLKKAIAIVKE